MLGFNYKRASAPTKTNQTLAMDKCLFRRVHIFQSSEHHPKATSQRFGVEATPHWSMKALRRVAKEAPKASAIDLYSF